MNAHVFNWRSSGAIAVLLLALAVPVAAMADPIAAASVAGEDLAALPEAAPKGFSTRVEPDKVELGRPFRFTIEVRHDPAERYALAGTPALGGLTARGAPTLDRTEEEGVAVTRISIDLVAFDALGDRELPEQLLVADGPAGQARLVVPGPPLHVIATSEGEELQNPPPEPLVVVALDRIGIAAAGLALVLALLAYVIWRRRRRRPAPVLAAPIDHRTPEERALAGLDALEADTTIPVRERYFGLSATVRGFLAEVSGLPAVDRTTEELCDELSRRAVPGLSLLSFRAWLGRGDLVRFAKQVPPHEAIVADVAEARALVRDVAAALRAEEERRQAEETAAAAPAAGEGGR